MIVTKNCGRLVEVSVVLVGLTAALQSPELRADDVAYRDSVAGSTTLIGYYPFDADLRSAVLDVHAWGNAAASHHGTLVGNAGFGEGAVGRQSLRPGEGRVDLGPVPEYEFADGTGAVEAFLFQSQATAYNPCFFSCRNGTETRYSLHGDSQGRGLWFWNGAQAVRFDLPEGAPPMLNRWVQVVFSFNAGTVKVFLDGEPLGEQAVPLGQPTGLPVQIGASTPGNDEPWPGLIDELAIYSGPGASGDWLGWGLDSFTAGGRFEDFTNTEQRFANSLGGTAVAEGVGNLYRANTLWWTWQAPADGWVLATAPGSSCVHIGLQMGEWDPANPATSTSARENYGNAHYGAGLRSAILFQASQGRNYRFGLISGSTSFPSGYDECAIDPVDPQLVEFERFQRLHCSVRVEQLSPPANDSSSQAAVVEGEFPTVLGSNWGATDEPDDPGGVEGLTGATVWWRWRAPSSREVSLSTRGSDIHTLLTVYRLDGSGTRLPVAANLVAPELALATNISPLNSEISFFPVSDVLRRTSRVRFVADRGAEYLIAVDGIRFADGAEGMGDIRLNWESVGIEAYAELQATTNQTVLLAATDLVNLGSLAEKLQTASRMVDRDVAERLSSETRNALGEYPAGAEELRARLVQELNDIILGPAFFDLERFADVPVESDTAYLISHPDPTQQPRLNRLLLDDAYPQELARVPRPLAVTVSGQITLVNRGVADSGPLRFRVIGTRIYPGTARSNRDPGRQESVELGTNLMTAPVTIEDLPLGTTVDVPVVFTIPGPNPGLLFRFSCAFENCTFECYDPRLVSDLQCFDIVPTTFFACSWRAGVMIEAEHDGLGWIPVAYYPLRHGPWPAERIELLNGPGPYDGAGGTGYGGHAVYSEGLNLVGPARMVSGSQTNLVAVFALFKDKQLRSTNEVSQSVALACLSGPGYAGANGSVEALAVQESTDIVFKGTYLWNGKPYSATITIGVDPVPRQDQTIAFAELPDRPLSDPPFRLQATATSGLPVRFQVVSGPAELSEDGILRVTNLGLVTVRAEQEGDTAWNPAPPVERTFQVGKGEQTIAFAELPDRILTDAPFRLLANATSLLAVRFRIVSGPAELGEEGLLHLTGVGPVTVRAEQDGDAWWNSAPPVERTFSVVDPPAAPQPVIEVAAEDEAGQRRVRLTVKVQAGWDVQLEVKTTLGDDSPWNRMGERRRSYGDPLVFEVPMQPGAEFFRVVAWAH